MITMGRPGIRAALFSFSDGKGVMGARRILTVFAVLFLLVAVWACGRDLNISGNYVDIEADGKPVEKQTVYKFGKDGSYTEISPRNTYIGGSYEMSGDTILLKIGTSKMEGRAWFTGEILHLDLKINKNYTRKLVLEPQY